jgi:hypothetical protein
MTTLCLCDFVDTAADRALMPSTPVGNCNRGLDLEISERRDRVDAPRYAYQSPAASRTSVVELFSRFPS